MKCENFLIKQPIMYLFFQSTGMVYLLYADGYISKYWEQMFKRFKKLCSYLPAQDLPKLNFQTLIGWNVHFPGIRSIPKQKIIFISVSIPPN